MNYADESQALDGSGNSGRVDNYLGALDRLAGIGTKIAGAFRGQSSAPAPVTPPAESQNKMPSWLLPVGIGLGALLIVGLVVSVFRGE